MICRKCIVVASSASYGIRTRDRHGCQTCMVLAASVACLASYERPVDPADFIIPRGGEIRGDITAFTQRIVAIRHTGGVSPEPFKTEERKAVIEYALVLELVSRHIESFIIAVRSVEPARISWHIIKAVCSPHRLDRRAGDGMAAHAHRCPGHLTPGEEGGAVRQNAAESDIAEICRSVRLGQRRSSGS